MVQPHRQCGEEGATAPLQSQEAEEMWLVTKTLTNFYRCTIESILLGCITAWYGNYTARNRRALQRVVQSDQRITGGKLPALLDTYSTRCHRRPKRSSRTSTTRATSCSPCYHPEGEVSTGASKLGPRNSFYLKAIRLLNSHH